jgi:hypothetical protein
MRLLSSDHLREGVELLCLAGATAEACRYLQAAGDWTGAALCVCSPAILDLICNAAQSVVRLCLFLSLELPPNLAS